MKVEMLTSPKSRPCGRLDRCNTTRQTEGFRQYTTLIKLDQPVQIQL
jgi:hypothetical protein